MFYEKGIENPQSDYLNLMRLALYLAKHGDIFVEVGVFLGESLSRLIDESIRLNKRISINAVDLFGHGDLLINHHNKLDIPTKDTVVTWNSKADGDWVFNDFRKNLRLGHRMQHLNSIIVADANKAASIFGNNSVFFCFIDAGHSYNDVFNNLCAWYPKMKRGGFLCGHDYFNGKQIEYAVQDFKIKFKLKLGLFDSNFVFRIC